ncbi:MAG: lipoate--protein ligase [Planctomycetaceae bacterium]|nr:lipoate--protein ligase [Planctomycetaceae bacterium]
MIQIENVSTDPAYNLALEEFLHLHRQPLCDVFLLWQNEPTVVIGRHQNTFDEIHRDYVETAGVHVVRRNSGGGAVYHDLGNLNFSFLVDDCENGFHFERFTQPVIRTLEQLGVKAENNGRNDVVIVSATSTTTRRKISGNAQYRRNGRLLHHGTILFDANLENLTKALNYAPEKYISRAVASIRSRVTNVCEHLPVQISMVEFRDLLAKNVVAEYGIEPGSLCDREQEAVLKLRDEKYRTRAWNYGHSPPFWTHTGVQKFSWGTLDIRLEVRDDKIASCVFYGDFFSLDDPQTLAGHLIGLTFDRRTLQISLPESEIHRVFPDLAKNQLLDMIF